MCKTEYGLQMFSLRDITKDDLRGALKGAAELGYKYIELAGLFDHSAAEVKGWLDEYGLICCATHTGLGALTPETIDATIAEHKTLNCSYLVVPMTTFWDSREKAESILDALNYAEKKLSEAGIRMAYHNHSWEFFPTDFGMVFEEELLARTKLDLELDTFWSFNANVDTLAFLEAHKDRIKIIHLPDGFPSAAECKSLARCHEGVIGVALGEGKAPVKEVHAWALKNGVQMVVESEGCDPTGLQEAGRCIAFLRSLDE